MYNNISQMEPMLPEYKRDELIEKAAKLLANSGALGANLADETAHSVSGLVTLMNSYYSNLIEGNKTTPIEIERALEKSAAADKQKDERILEHIAHIHVQERIDSELRKEPGLNIFTTEFIRMIHKDFYSFLPAEFRFITRTDGSRAEVIPGELRKENVIVGRHIAPDPNSLTEFLGRFCEVYGSNQAGLPNTGPLVKIIGAAASHHRLAWIHPFMDGNGRTARLFTHAYLVKAGIDSRGLWSVSRGFARSINSYYDMLARADETRRNDFDGRGNLSDMGLYEFCNYFLDTALDQTQFMASLYDFESAVSRIKKYTEVTGLKPESFYILKEAFIMGKVKRGDVPKLTSMPERSARRVVSELAARDLIVSRSHKDPLRIAFPLDAAEYYFPRLFPPIG
jgi:Fic family protein